MITMCNSTTGAGHRRDQIQEEGEYEYISDHEGGTSNNDEAHVEPAILVQPLGEADDDEAIKTPGSVVPLCEVKAKRPCAQDSGGFHGHGGHGYHYGKRVSVSGNACVGIGTTAAVVSPFAPELAGVLVGVFLAVRC